MGIKSRVEYYVKHHPTALRVFKAVLSLGVRAVGLFVPTDRRLVLLTGLGGGYNDSPRVLYEAWRERPDAGDYRFVWALRDPDGVDIPGAQKVRLDTPAYFLMAQRAAYWVACVNVERSLTYKKKHVRYLNTWHGVPLKSIGNSRATRHDFDFGHIDLFCASGEFDAQAYVDHLGVRPQSLLRCGMPRNDMLYRPDPEKTRAVREALGVAPEKKIILYAPTWRDSADGGASYAIAPPIDLDRWRAALADRYVLCVRAHSITRSLTGIGQDDFCRDVTDWPQMNELLLATDVLVSDYSSAFFDFSILERPMACYAYDLDAYAAQHGFLMDLHTEIPNVLTRQEDLIAFLRGYDEEAEREKTRACKRKYMAWGGSATQAALDALVTPAGAGKAG